MRSIQSRALAERLEGLLAQHTAAPLRATVPPPPLQRLVVRDGESLLLLEPSQVDWIESAGNYVHVHSGARAYLARTTMDRVARRLTAGGNFIRVRRSALINVRALTKIERYGKGTFVVHLRTGAKVISGRFYNPELRRLLRPDR